MSMSDYSGVSERVSRRLWEEFQRIEDERVGTARQAHWEAEDGWLIDYSTSRVTGGPHDGKFVVSASKPVGKGARTDAREWICVYVRAFSTRKAAKARAVALYGQHSPKWLARRRTS